MLLENKRGWTYIINTTATENQIDYENEKKKNLTQGTSGKYLFFSTNKSILINLAETILTEYNLYQGKVQEETLTFGNEYVLCIYDFKNRFSNELVKFSNENIKYRFWKSNSKTISQMKRR